MKIENLKTIEALEIFLQGNQKVAFSIFGNKTERYNFVRKTLIKFSYITLSKKDKGTVIRYLLKMTEYSRQQLTRLIKKYTIENPRHPYIVPYQLYLRDTMSLYTFSMSPLYNTVSSLESKILLFIVPLYISNKP